jgi:hypothetical protein
METRENDNKQIWEMELLISGALVFSLLQLPGPILRELVRLQTRLAGAEAAVARIVVSMALTVVLVLAAAFVIHLAGRAFWVGLMGLRRAFPAWVCWDRLKQGPMTTAVNRQMAADPDRLIDGIDRFCSTIFSLAFSLVAIVVVETLLIGVLALVAGVVTRLVHGLRFTWVLTAALGAPIVVGLLLSGIDALIGKGYLHFLGASKGFTRLASGYIRAFNLALGGPMWNPVFLVFRSNLDLRRYAALMAAIFVGLGVCVPIAAIVWSRDVDVLHSLRFFPADSRRLAVNPGHYRDSRQADEVYLRTPSIQSEQVDGPVIKLFLPHVPDTDNPLLDEVCPGIEPLRAGGIDLGNGGHGPSEERLAATRDCLRALWRVELDGAELGVGEYYFFTEPGSGVHGLMGYLPTTSLTPGKHELRVMRYAARKDGAQPANARDRFRGREDRIQLWLTP